MSDEPYLVLNKNDGVDIIHDPSRWSESCNTDQIEGREKVDVSTAAALLDQGEAVRCRHCNPEESRS